MQSFQHLGASWTQTRRINLALTKFRCQYGHIVPGQNLSVEWHRGQNRAILRVDAEIALGVRMLQDGVSGRWRVGTWGIRLSRQRSINGVTETSHTHKDNKHRFPTLQ